MRLLHDLGRDLRLAARLLARDGAFSVAVVAILGTAIGVNATVFAITDGLERRGLPVDAPDRMMALASQDESGRQLGMSLADLDDARRADAFTGLAAYTGVGVNITEPDIAADRVNGAFVSGNTFALLGERPIAGRDLRVDDDRPGAAPVCILGYSVWKNRYAGSDAVIGRVIKLNGVATTVVGVMREGFRYPLVHDLWLPISSMPGLTAQTRETRRLQVLGRLAEHVSRAHAQAELDTIAARLQRQYPDTNRNIRFVVEPFTGGFNPTDPWTAMLLAVGLVLAIACANTATLLPTRGARRTHDIAIRRALGATRGRIVRQLVAEHLVLAAMAGMVGFGIAEAGVRLWIASLPVANWPYWFRWSIDIRVIAYLAAITFTSVIVFGVGPALHTSRAHPAERLNDAGRSGTLSRAARRWTTALLAGEFAMTLALLAGAGLMVRTLIAVYRADAVIDTSPLLIASCDLPVQRYPTPDERAAFYQRVEQRLGAIPAISSVSMMSALPFYTAPARMLAIDGRDARAVTDEAGVSYVAVGTAYFDALGVRLVAGRAFDEQDGMPGHDVAIVNQRLASMYLRGVTAIGQRIRLTDPNRPNAGGGWLTIVGISPTVRQHYAQEIDPVVYVPYRADPVPEMALLVHAKTTTTGLVTSMRSKMRELDLDVPLFNIMPLARLVEGSRFANRVFATMFAVFGVLALLLSAAGLFAVTSYSVVQRTREIGVRMALGAQPAQVTWLFVRGTVVPLIVGIVCGLAAALAVGRLVQTMLIQTSAHDPLMLVAIVVILTVIATAAVVWPARRAARLEPVATLRQE